MSTTYHEAGGITIYHGDCRDVLPRLPDASVDSVVTDPPYELGFMGKHWDRSGIAYQVEVWRECLRVLKPGGHLLAFGGSRTYHRLACAIEDAGFEIRDQIQWLYGSGFPKSLDVSKAVDAAAGAEREVVGLSARHGGGQRNGFDTGSSTLGNAVVPFDTRPATDAAKQWDGWGTALKPAHEPIVLARKPLIGTVVENVLQHGTGGLNIDGCRIGLSDYDRDEYIPNRVGYKDGIDHHQIADPSKRNPNAYDIPMTGQVFNQKGRWPANVIHDGSEEVLAGFPETTSGLMKQRIEGGTFNVFSKQYPREVETIGDSGSAARFFYCAKASKKDREEGLGDLPLRSAGEVTDRKDGSDGLNSPRAGAGRTNGSRNHHPTVKPTKLMRYLVRLVTPPGGTVLDCFAGSGSTGKACALEGMKAILIDSEIEYCELAAARSRLQRPTLFT